MPVDIQSLAAWSPPKEVRTKVGPRMLRTAEVTPAFSAAWKQHRDEMKAAGASWSKDRLTNEWTLAWWLPLPVEVQQARKQARKESVAASRATAAVADFPHPEGIDYLPFQKAGIQYALDRPGVLIADEMGLGKTIETIGIINTSDAQTALVICPKSLKLNWLRELTRWLTKDLTVGVVDGHWPGTQIVIMNYDSLDKWQAPIREREWDLLVLDEAHLIKNSRTKRSRLIKGWKPKPSEAGEPIEPIRAKRHLRLTGTPICNRPSELYNLISDLTPVFGSWYTFAKRYCALSFNSYGSDSSGASNLDELQERLRETIMVRRLKADVLTELPKKIRQIVELEAESAEQRRAVEREGKYEADAETRLLDLRAAAELSKAESEAAYQAAVEALKDAMQVDFTEISRLRHETALAKVPQVLEHLRQCMQDDDAKKIILAAHHHDVIDQLYAGCMAEGWQPVQLTGANSEQERQAAVDAFQNRPTVRVFIGGIQAAGMGITLTAASHVVFSELDWVPGNVTQFEDRAHRIGQSLPVLVQHIVLADSIDARMAQTLVGKQKVIDDALDVQHPERQAPVYTPKESPATQDVKPADLVTVTFTDAQAEAIQLALPIVAGMDTDHAMNRNNVGFSKIDVAIGHSLAERARAGRSLSQKQLGLGMRLARKYHRQLPDEINAALKAEGEPA